MNLAYLRSNVVIRIAPEGWDPGSLDFDATRDATGASVGATWNGTVYVPRPRPAVETNRLTIEQQAVDALASLRQYRDLASPTNAQTVAVVKLLCRVAISLIRLQLARHEATD